MKTAQYWAEYSLIPASEPSCRYHLIKQIQLDAMREGMQRAAAICAKNALEFDEEDVEAESILLAAENLTEKDL